jgi:hypothetical protein
MLGRCNRLVPDAHGTQSACDDRTVDAIPIPDHVARSLVPGECLRYLTRTAGICLVDVNMALACTERECGDVYGPSFIEIASDRCRGGLTRRSIPLVEFAHQLDQLLEQHRGVILAIAHDDRRDHLRLVEIDETYIVSSQASH